MYTVYFSLGSNLGDRLANLTKGVQLIEKNIARMQLYSSIYETSAWGKTQQPDFLNMVVKGVTILEPLAVLKQCQEIEKQLGRKREEHWGSRTLDIDILFIDDKIIDLEDLKVPHPYLHQRKFVLKPLAEISPEMLHPVLKDSINSIYSKCEDDLKVRIFDKFQHN